MRAGKLQHRIIIQQLTPGRDLGGGTTETWSTFATVWAAVEPVKGREYFAAQQVNAEVTHRIRIRYRSGITPKMQVSWGTRTFRIEAVLNIEEADREVQLMTVEVVT